MEVRSSSGPEGELLTMKRSKWIAGAVYSAALVLPLLWSGCRSDVYYQNRAAERARKFLLKEATDLNWEQQEFVRYSDPVFMHSHVIGGHSVGNPSQLGSEQRQICVTWQIPGKEGLYMVFGVSGSRMANWYPERLLRRNYAKKSAPLVGIAPLAYDYAKNNLFHELSVEDMNRVRFSAPALVQTNFNISVAPPEGSSAEEKAAFLENHGKKLQLALVWKLDEKKSVYFCGFGMPDLSQWQIMRAGIIGNTELRSRTVRTILTPEQRLDKLPDLSVVSRIGCECEHSENCIKAGVCQAAGKKTTPGR